MATKPNKILADKPKVRLIYACTEDRVIGRQGRLPWHITPDMKRFAELTTGAVAVMGSGTWFSLPGKQRPLKDRVNIVLSRSDDLKLPGATISQSLNSVLADYNDRDIWIIGGGQILKQAIKHESVDEIYLTLIHTKVAGDCTSPIIDPTVWELTDRSDMQQHDTYRYQYLIYKRRRT